MSASEPPTWPHCEHGADPATDPVGCRGIHVPGRATCLTHLGDAERITYLTGLMPGAEIDHRGTSFTEQLLTGLLNALRDPTTGNPRLGGANFGGTQFSGEARFGGVQFVGHADFGGAQFSGDAAFQGAQFSDGAAFDGARFSGRARFDEAQFSGDVDFDGTQFSFGAWFNKVRFSDSVWFDCARFSDSVWFEGTRFEGASVIGPLVCAGSAMLTMAVFKLPVTLELATQRVVAERTRWESTATLRLRYATVDLSHTVLSAPVAVTAAAAPFTIPGGRSGRAGADWICRREGCLASGSGRRASGPDRHRPDRLPVLRSLPPRPTAT
jgi:hypothetical protein